MSNNDPTGFRPGYDLTDDAWGEHTSFMQDYEDRGCTCFSAPPCSFCTHPGNPQNLLEDDEAWVPARGAKDDIWEAVRSIACK